MTEAVLKVNDLKKYFGSNLILDGIDLTVNKGEVMGFLGPNGAGKTTAIKTVLGFLSADGGTVEIDGKSVKTNYEEAMGLVGGIVENPDMYKQFSGRQNLELYARIHGDVTKERIDEVVELVGLKNRIDEKVKKYSLGMKQRLGLAQAILTKPKLLLLDEPTNGLDPAGIKELRDVLKNLAHVENVGILVSSHQLAEMQLMCDRVTIIRKGKIIAVKSMEELGLAGDNLRTRYKLVVEEPRLAVEKLQDNEVSVDTKTGEVLISAFRDEIPDILKDLLNGGVKIYGVQEAKKTLEDAYIEITEGGAANENA